MTLSLDDLLTEPAPLGPRASNTPHVLVLSYDEDGDAEFEIEHHDDCPTVARWDGEVLDYDCAVGMEVASSGIEFSFSGTPEEDHSYAEPLRVPGRYLIEWWTETHRGFDYTEYDAGLRLVYPEEAHRG
jgi:hypothetical protein